MCYVCNFAPTVCFSGEITHISRRKGERLICNSRISRLKIARSPRRFPRRAAAAAPSFEDVAISPSPPLLKRRPPPFSQTSSTDQRHLERIFLVLDLAWRDWVWKFVKYRDGVTGDGIYFSSTFWENEIMIPFWLVRVVDLSERYTNWKWLDDFWRTVETAVLANRENYFDIINES